MTELQEHTWADDGGAVPAEPKSLRWAGMDMDLVSLSEVPAGSLAVYDVSSTVGPITVWSLPVVGVVATLR